MNILKNQWLIVLLGLWLIVGAFATQERIVNLRKAVKKLQGKMARLRQLVMKELPSTSCDDHYKHGVRTDGVYVVYLNASTTPVYCDFDFYGHGKNWMVIQRRVNGKLDFHQSYENYVKGFGNALGEYWMGLEKIHEFTQQLPHELLIVLEDAGGNKAFAHYKDFSIGDGESGYKLRVNGYNGTAGDCFSQHNGDKFSAKDRDQDLWFRSCAEERRGGWWYKKCTFGNINGKYVPGGELDYQGIYWFYWKFTVESMTKTMMMIRPTRNPK